MMDQETRDALEASITKWENSAVAEQPKDAKLGALDCPL